MHGRGLGQPLPQGRGNGLPADHQMGRVVAALVQQALGEQSLGIGGSDVEIVDPVRVDVRGESRRVPVSGVVQQVQLVPVDHPQQRVPGRVEGERGAVRDPEALPAGPLDGRGDVVRAVPGAEVGE